MATYTLSPMPEFQFFTNAGGVLSGGSLETFAAGSAGAIPRITYADEAGATPNPTTITLDSAGRPSVSGVEVAIYLVPGLSYMYILKDAAGNVVWTRDNIAAIPTVVTVSQVTGTAGEALSAQDGVYLSDGSGALTAGRWYKWDADNAYSSTLPIIGMVPSAITSGATGTIQLAGPMTVTGPLSAGAVYYVSGTSGALTLTAPTNARVAGVANTTTSIILGAAPNTRDVIQVTGTAGESLSAQDGVYLSDGSGALTAGRWYKWDADNTYSGIVPLLGMAVTAISSAGTGPIRIAGRMLVTGPVVAGTPYYVSGTAGALTASAPSLQRFVGVADTTTSIILAPNPPYAEPLRLGNGGVSAPAYSFSGSTGTGLYVPATNTLGLAANGLLGVTVDVQGYVDLATQPRCTAYAGAAQTVTDGNTTTLTLDAEDFDVGGMHSTSGNTERVTIPAGGDGTYRIVGMAQGVPANNNTTCTLHLNKFSGGATVVKSSRIFVETINGSACFVVEALLVLAAAEYVFLTGQASGSNVAFGSSTRGLAITLDAMKVA